MTELPESTRVKPKVVLVGSGGHAKVIIEILEEQPSVEIAGCTTCDRAQSRLLDYSVLGTDDELGRIFAAGIHHAFIAIGDNQRRRSAALRALELGFTLVNAVSIKATISPRTTLGFGVAVMPGAVINSGTCIGNGAVVNTGATVDHDCVLGDYVHLAPGANLAGRVEVSEGALVGIGSCVIPGIKIGCWAVVGAGAVVVRNVPHHSTEAGVPARPIKSRPST